MTVVTRLVPTIIAFNFILACHQSGNLKPTEGYFSGKGGKIWYKIVGEGEKVPILTLHGGPGAPGYYLKPLENLAVDRSIIFYHQLGCGKSDRIQDTSLMTTRHYVEELGELIKFLGLKKFYLYGQSWGTMLATEFYLSHPEGIEALILSSPYLSTSLWIRDADTLISRLSDSIQIAIRASEKNGSYTDSPYLRAVNIYYQRHLARKLPWSADTDSSFTQIGENVYNSMWGPSEFTCTGNLKNADLTNRLGEIKVPTFLICGEFDEARPSTVKYFQSLIPGSKFVLIENAGHLTMQDNSEADERAITEFLSSLEK
ncbi:MAG: proline iminopeptidase-family hydrolase [Chitinophagales bacterium]